MKTGIIGLPQVGKTSLFRILTKAAVSATTNPRDAHIGVAKVPDDRLDKLAAHYNPKKLTHASVEYVDVGAIGQEALKESGYIGHLRKGGNVPWECFNPALNHYQNGGYLASVAWPYSVLKEIRGLV